jgi:hypothetical protein
MRRIVFGVLAVYLFSLVLLAGVSAQDLGNIGSIVGGGSNSGNSGVGNSGNSNSGSYTGSGSNSSGYTSTGSSSTGSSSGSSSTGTEFGTTIETPTFQGFEDISSQTFIGRDSSVPFIGREEAFSDRQTASNSKRTTTTSSAARRTTSSRMTSSRSTTSRSSSRQTSSGNGRTVRAVTQAGVAFSPMEVNRRTTEFQTRITRLPNLTVLPEQIGVTLENTPQGNIAVLTGNVVSEHERKIMKQLLLLEPGVDKVENKLSIVNSY